MEGLIVLIFIVGYAAIVLEHKLSINKSASALLTGVLCWTIVALVSTNIEETLQHFVLFDGSYDHSGAHSHLWRF